MKIIITENQHYVLRRLQQFFEIVEDHIEGYELNEDGSWWCGHFNADTFFENLMNSSIEEFENNNWNFFYNTWKVEDIDISILNKIIEQNYGNYIRNLWVRKCS